MMKRCILLTGLLFVGSIPSFSQETPDAYSPQLFEALLARLKAGDAGIDYTALRLSFVATDQFQPYDFTGHEVRRRMFEAVNELEDYVGALRKADSLLAGNYLDLDAHMVALVSAQALGDTTRAAFHRAVTKGLVASIADGHDGRSEETPFRVISVTEEHAMLRALGWRSRSFSILQCGERVCEVAEVIDGLTGDRFEVFFDITIPMSSGL